jgi:hypothetical protein
MKIKKSWNGLLCQAVLTLGIVFGACSTSRAAQVGLNFEDEWGGAGGAPVVSPAFGLDQTNWINLVRVLNSESGAFATNQTIPLPGGGQLFVEWSAINTYSVYADVSTNGDEQVTYGYLDDSGAGYRVAISGFRDFAASYTLTLIASSDAASGFADALVAHDSDTNTVTYPSPYTPNYTLNEAPNPTGLAAVSTETPAIVTSAGNNKVVITGTAKNGQIRSTLAGILITYTPGGGNRPEMSLQPVAPTNTVYTGQAFTVSAMASGTPTLSYQWRLAGAAIADATGASFTKNGVTGADAGNYDVVVTNAYGSVTSAVVVVAVSSLEQPVITKGPLAQSFYQGYPATFTVEATGGQLAYQWKHATTNLPGATGATLTVPSVTSQDAGTYEVVVSNPVGNATASAALTVVQPLSGTFEEAMAQTKPLLWFRYSDTAAVLQDLAANSGSLAATAAGMYIGAAAHPVAGGLAGSTDTAVSFAGGRVSVPYLAELNPAVFTVEAWLKPAVANAGTTLTCPLSSVHIADPRAGWIIYQSVDGWNLRTFNHNGTTAAVNITGGPAPVPGTWYHVVASWDGTVGRVYVNGVLSATSTATTFVENPDGAFAVGARSDGAFVWAGAADEVALYSSALSDAQVLAHYQNGTNAARLTPYASVVTTDGAAGYYHLNEAAFGGKPANFGTLGGGWNGAYSDGGGVLGTPKISVGQAGPVPPGNPGFEATNRALTVENGWATAPPLALGNNVTVATWIKRQAVSTTGDLSWPAWLGGGGLHLNNGSAATPDAELRYHWNGGQWDWSSGLFVPAEVWTFVAMVVEPTKATFYMSDGTSLKSSVHTATHAAMAVTSPPGFGGNQPGRADRTFLGQLDESAVFDRALTQSEINTLFMRGTGAKLSVTLAPGGVIEDTKPVGTPHPGYNYGATWVPANTDLGTTPITRTGAQQFSAATGSQIVVAADADFNSPVGSFSFWMRAIAPLPGPGSEAAILIDRRTTTGAVIALNDGGAIFVQCASAANTFSGGYLPDDLWHHVVVTYDQSAAGSITIYIDGVLAATNPNTAAWSWPAAQRIEIGRSHDGYWRRFDGFLDDIRIYNRVLTEAEAGQIFASGVIVDANALKLRYDFGTAGIGHSIAWPFGSLESSPVLGPDATWTPVPGATSPYPFLPADPSLFYRAKP